ncbi:MAG: JDVT-CTERM domain-containing protein, partial [Gammaproteobacteria bacterium]|nr:JDVT-CTERM domain-containing protein [Gammaproteobacteria bacterium]
LEGKFVSSLVIDPNNSQTLYAGTIEDIDITTGGVYHFQKGGIPPVAAITTDNPEVNPPDVVILNGSSSSDSDGSIVNYAWSQTAGPDVTLTNDTGFDTSFVSPNVESTTILTFQLTVTDNDGLTNSTSIDITVSPIPTGDGSDGGNNSGGNSSGGGGGCTIRSSAEFDPVLLLLIAVGLIYLARKRSMNKVS